jgi:mRNA interferase RelE/StbE
MPWPSALKISSWNSRPIPGPPGCKKLRGRDAWRIHIGDYRAIYEIHDGQLIVTVITIGHRREVYE